VVYVPVIITVWIAIPAYMTVMAYLFTDIIDGVCIPMGVYSSVAAEKTVASVIFFVACLLPLMLMIFFYSRIVHALRTKVSIVIVMKSFADNYYT